MAETPTPAPERSGGEMWKWIVGIIVVVLVIWIIAGLFGDGTGEDSVAPPVEEEQPVPQQDLQQDTVPQPQSELQSGDSGRVVAGSDRTIAVDWTQNLVIASPNTS